MWFTCLKCGYDIIQDAGVWVDAWDEDEVCYDEYTNMLGFGEHVPNDPPRKYDLHPLT